MLAFIERQAVRIQPHRWTLAAIAVACIAISFTCARWFLVFSPPVTRVAAPMALWAWGLLCLSIWFSPSGPFSLSGPMFRWLPRPIIVFVRWYAAVFLFAWFFGVLVFTLMGALEII
jgi:hypothetical protein